MSAGLYGNYGGGVSIYDPATNTTLSFGSYTSGGIPVVQAGTTGQDHSANQPTLPNVGANFGGTGPYANYVLVATLPASASRISVDVENTSGAQIAVLRDDGSAAAAAPPANASIFSLAGGAGVGQQGGAWSSTTFKGRLQIYAPASSAQVCIMTE